MHGAERSAIDGAGARVGAAERSDYYFVQDVAAARFDHRVSRLVGEDAAAAASWTDRSGHGDEGADLVGGIGGTIRISLTPRPGGDRREEVYAACELLQALGLRSFSPSVTACPGCGRT